MREQPVQAKAIEKLFARFDDALQGAGYLTMEGQIIDARLLAAPVQNLSDEEKATIRRPMASANGAVAACSASTDH